MNKAIRDILIATLFFSLMNLFVKLLPNLPAFQVVFFRSLISLVLSLIGIYRLGISPFGQDKKWLILRGTFGVIALTMYFATLQALPMASAVTIQYLSPIFTTIIGIFVLDEKVTWKQWLFFLISFIGILLIKGFDPNVSLLYFVMGIAAAFCSGFAYNCVRRLKATEHPLVIVLYFPLISLPITGITAFIPEVGWVMPQGIQWLYILLVGVFTQIAQVYMTKALQGERIAIISSFRYLGILYAILWGLTIFNETYSVYAYLGMALVIIGVVLNILFKPKVVRN